MDDAPTSGNLRPLTLLFHGLEMPDGHQTNVNQWYQRHGGMDERNDRSA